MKTTKGKQARRSAAKMRAYLEKHPNTKAKELQEKFNLSLATIYRAINKTKTDLSSSPNDPSPIFIETPIWQPPTLLPVPEPRTEVTTDQVNHPPHYTVGGIETIDFIEAKGLQNNYYLSNAIKYISRAPYKNDYKQDLQKAVWYLHRAITHHNP